MEYVVYAIGATFYLLLVAGAAARAWRLRSGNAYTQLMGTTLPLVVFGACVALKAFDWALVLYGLAWLPMGVAYLLEGLRGASGRRALPVG